MAASHLHCLKKILFVPVAILIFKIKHSFRTLKLFKIIAFHAAMFFQEEICLAELQQFHYRFYENFLVSPWKTNEVKISIYEIILKNSKLGQRQSINIVESTCSSRPPERVTIPCTSKFRRCRKISGFKLRDSRAKKERGSIFSNLLEQFSSVNLLIKI